MPKMKNTKKHRSRTLPSIGSVSSNNVTRIRKPVNNMKFSYQDISRIYAVVYSYCSSRTPKGNLETQLRKVLITFCNYYDYIRSFPTEILADMSMVFV